MVGSEQRWEKLLDPIEWVICEKRLGSFPLKFQKATPLREQVVIG